MKDYKNLYESLVYDISRVLEDAQWTYDDVSQNKLAFNSVEAEGFLRCARYIKSIVEENERNISALTDEETNID